jgi:class 3 adenylate cyclase
VERRLAAVLAADVAGYSRLMGRDEERTLEELKTFRKTLVDPGIATHRGRIVKTTGDGILVEFASAVDAAPVQIQREMAEQNAGVSSELKIEYRIGIHVGDIIIDDDDIFGDGVNIAARLEGIAEPGGVCVSDDAQRQIRGKIGIVFDDIGEQILKNIAEPMRAWHMRLAGDAIPAIRSVASPTRVQDLALPDKPSIVVLPFDNMSAEAGQDYLADGIVEAITAALSCIRSFLRHRTQFLSPIDPMNFNNYVGIGSAHEVAEEYDEAAAFYRRALEERPHANWIYRNLASSWSGAGRDEEAKRAFAELMRCYPDLTISKFKQAMVFSPAVLNRMGENLRKLGLPD